MRHVALVVSFGLSSIVLLATTPVWAKDHASRYEVGIFITTQRLNDGTYSYASCNSLGCSGSGYDASHNIHYVRTPEGLYAINAPVSVAGTLLLGLSTPGGNSPTVHKIWFMDDLNDGDRVLFTAKCNRHNLCQFWLPDPDKPGKEFVTNGSFHPVVSKTNTRTLCGTGKLSAAVEQEVCGTRSQTQTSQRTEEAKAPNADGLTGSTMNDPVRVSQPLPIVSAQAELAPSAQPGLASHPTQTLASPPLPRQSASTSDSSRHSLERRGVLGIEGADWEQGDARGVEVIDVSPDSAAEIAGLKKGNVITNVNGVRVRSNQELAEILGQLEPGSRVSISYIFKSNLGWMPAADTVAILTNQ